jgi:TonB family protein
MTGPGPLRGSFRDDPDRERRRSLASLGAALGVHLVLLAAFALGLGALTPPTTIPEVTIELLGASGTGGEPAPGSGGGAGAPGPAAAPAGPAASLPASAAAPGGPGGFTIPTPRAPAPDSSAPAGSPAFRQSGGRTGVVQGIPSTPSLQPGPDVAPIRQGSGSGTAAASGSGATSVQRSGTAVAVGGSTGTGGSLDLGKLDKALASGGSGTGGGAGGTGTGGGSGSGGSGGGGAGGSGSGGSGSGGGSTGSGAANYPVQWGSDGGEGRKMVITSPVKLPAWVSQQGLTLSVTVSFIVLDNGVISGVTVKQSSGYALVDQAVVDAIRLCQFNPAPNAPPVSGIIPYLIRPN